MEALNIVTLTPAHDATFPRVDAACLELIRNAAPGITVRDGSDLLLREMRGDADARKKLDGLLQGADVLFGFSAPHEVLRRAPKVTWFQATSAGVDRLMRHEIWQSDVTITGVSGIHAVPISEYVLGTMLTFAKGTLEAVRNQRENRWGRYMAAELAGRTVGIVGLGHIGREIARLAKAFSMRVLATRRSTKRACRARNVDQLLPQRDLKQMLAESDYVVLSVPLTPETEKLIGAAELKAMKPTACLINIARGGIIDQEALVEALRKKQIAGAGLDVTDPEPLPPDSPLWGFENVLITPHVSGGMDDYMLRATRLFCENLRRRHEGKALLNVVKRARGY